MIDGKNGEGGTEIVNVPMSLLSSGFREGSFHQRYYCSVDPACKFTLKIPAKPTSNHNEGYESHMMPTIHKETLHEWGRPRSKEGGRLVSSH